MNDRMFGYMLLAVAVILYILSAATAFAALYALTVTTTLAAIESAFGTFVLLIMLLVLARKCWDSGKKRLVNAAEQGGSGAGKSL